MVHLELPDRIRALLPFAPVYTGEEGAEFSADKRTPAIAFLAARVFGAVAPPLISSADRRLTARIDAMWEATPSFSIRAINSEVRGVCVKGD
jgi:hypothetical protein